MKAFERVAMGWLLAAGMACGGGTDREASAPLAGAGACAGACPVAGASGMAAAGTSAGAAGMVGGGGAGNAGQAGQTGTAGAAGDAGSAGTPPVTTGSCPVIADEIAAGTAASRFAVLLETEDIWNRVGHLTLGPDHVYFSLGPQLVRVPKQGGALEMLRSVAVSALAVAGTDLIWAEAASDGTHRVLKAAIGSTAEPTELVAGLAAQPYPMMADASNVYWGRSGEGGGIDKVALAGGTAETLAADHAVDDFALLGSDVYFLSGAALMRVPTTGGDATMVATLFFGGEIASDGTAIYWADGSEGTIRKWIPGATEGELLATRTDAFSGWPERLSADDGVAYWSEGGFCSQVYRVNADGSGHTQVMEGFGEVTYTASDASGLYVSDDHGLYSMDR